VDGKPHLAHYGLADGLPSLDVYMLGADHDGNVWAGGAYGLTEFFRNGHTLRYTRADGLIWNDLSERSFFAEEDGTLLFGTSGGLARYNPISADERVELPPRVVITSAQLGARDRIRERNPEAPRSDNTFQVDFAALTYRDPENVRCSYRLAGLETEPDETSGREARYPALPPGNYRFTVACRSARGTLSFPAEFSFTVIPAWWQRWYSRGSYSSRLFALYCLVSYRTRSCRANASGSNKPSPTQQKPSRKPTKLSKCLSRIPSPGRATAAFSRPPSSDTAKPRLLLPSRTAAQSRHHFLPHRRRSLQRNQRSLRPRCRRSDARRIDRPHQLRDSLFRRLGPLGRRRIPGRLSFLRTQGSCYARFARPISGCLRTFQDQRREPFSPHTVSVAGPPSTER
jgi:hypothetical protein